MGFFKSIGRKFSSAAKSVAHDSQRLGMKAGKDIQRFGMKAGHELSKVQGVGKQIANGISDVNSVVQQVAPLVAPLAGPYAPVIMAGAKGLDTVNSGIHQARTFGAGAVKRGKDSARQIQGEVKQLAGAVRGEAQAQAKDARKQLISFGDQVKAIPRPAVLK